ncbi:carbohydrate kinase family protein [Nocardioides mesophilus]|uniref:Carbohydrate kinase n=1 Tax=Nocardioides mesophilus TaxID=433659 RepID=A0A7G9R7U6_9ACTN|nr:carbohydrate kinase [Nocardioides mesophilus]QNN51671.1 carbohydrate kinase [Nocardioides mesophilus]
MSSSPYVVAGEALVDIVVPAEGGEEHAPGGSPLNVAVGLARLGVDTVLITELGDDEHGKLTAEHAVGSGVVLHEQSVLPGHRTSTATAHLGHDRAATYDFDLTWDIGARQLPAGARGLHVGSIGASLRPGRENVVDLVRQAAAAGLLVSFDPNARPAFLPEPEQAFEDLLEVAAFAQLVKLSDEDVEHLAPGRSPADLAAGLLEHSATTRLVVVTHGGTAAEAYTRTETVRVPSRPVEVVDTVGAGDSFMAALIATVLEWGIDDHSRERLEALLTAAHQVAALTCGRRGANPPTRRELPSGWPAG